MQGLTDAVGISNFKADRVRQASRILQARLRCTADICLHKSTSSWQLTHC